MNWKRLAHFIQPFNDNSFIRYYISNMKEINDMNISFSQDGDDIILQHLFEKKLKKKEIGHYIDIGAYHSFRFSNSAYFYYKGWRGWLSY